MLCVLLRVLVKKKLHPFLKHVLFIVSLTLLSACVPAVKTVFLTASVKGTIIDAASLKPAPNVFIAQQYDNRQIASTHTNKDGEFELEAHSQVQLKLMMPGHSLKNYTLVTSFQNSVNHHIYRASRVMYSKRTISDETVFIDSEPLVIAPPPNKNYRATEQWRRDIEAQGFSSCNNIDAARRMINHLAIARKVFSHDNPQLAGLAYNQVLLAKEHFYNACKIEPFLKQTLQKELENIGDEASSYAIDQTQLF